ncbi:hypothetical protein GCM10029978_065390 [Actinoallomurus acanthiterrae]
MAGRALSDSEAPGYGGAGAVGGRDAVLESVPWPVSMTAAQDQAAILRLHF